MCSTTTNSKGEKKVMHRMINNYASRSSTERAGESYINKKRCYTTKDASDSKISGPHSALVSPSFGYMLVVRTSLAFTQTADGGTSRKPRLARWRTRNPPNPRSPCGGRTHHASTNVHVTELKMPQTQRFLVHTAHWCHPASVYACR